MEYKKIRENCIASINEFFECEELIYKAPWDKKNKDFFLNNQLEKRVFLYKFLEKRLFKKVKKTDNKSIKILEIGPSEGIISRMIRNNGYDINIMEYEKNGKNTVPNSKDFYPDIATSFCQFDREKFPYESDTFDFVISFGVIEHIEPPTAHFWSEMKRVLKDNGFLFVDNPNPHNFRKKIYSALGLDANFDIPDFYNQKDYFTGHYREHSEKELIYCLKDNIELIDSGYFPFASYGYLANASIINKILIHIYDFICKIFRSNLDTVYVIGKK